jgi:Mg2+-importing ATPase
LVDTKLAEYSGAGYRSLAVASKTVEAKTSYSIEDESDLTLLGFLVFSDPPKKDARQAIAQLKEMGVNVKILTGDNELVAGKICDELGVSVKSMIRGSELIHLSLSEIRAAVEEATIFARMTPEQKLDIIKALKRNGHVVGFMGDGVNDAPALHEADVGISVDSAVDVSKDAADIVLLEKDLRVLADGIEEGRKIFGNTIKYILMGTSSNFGNMFSASAASLFLPFLPMLPMQILFMNLLYDVSNMTLPTDNVDEEYTKWPRRWDIGFVRKFTLFFGPFSSLYDFLTFGIMLFIFGASASVFQSGWFVESFWTEVLVIFVIRTRRIPFVTSRPGKWLLALTLSAVAFGTVLPFTLLGDFLGFTALPAQYWLLLILMVATYLLLVDAGKVFFYKVCRF